MLDYFVACYFLYSNDSVLALLLVYISQACSVNVYRLRGHNSLRTCHVIGENVSLGFECSRSSKQEILYTELTGVTKCPQRGQEIQVVLPFKMDIEAFTRIGNFGYNGDTNLPVMGILIERELIPFMNTWVLLFSYFASIQLI